MTFRISFEMRRIIHRIHHFQSLFHKKICQRQVRNRNWGVAEVLERRQLLSAQTGIGISPADNQLDTASSLMVEASKSRISQAFGQTPLSFEANEGQTDAKVGFLSRGSGYTLFLTPNEAVMNLQQSSLSGQQAFETDATVLRMQLVGADGTARAIDLNKQIGVSNYFTGDVPAQWQTNIANYGKVEYQNVYDGIDVVYYGNQRQLEYDFVLAVGADPNKIQLNFKGAESISISPDGNLVLHAAGGDMVEHAPVVYQENNGVRQAVEGHYVLEGNGHVGFHLGVYDTTRSLVIDPVLSYSTYLGGQGDEMGYSIAIDGSGNAYVTGITTSTNFPTNNPPQASNGTSGTNTVFVSKLNATGSAFIYSTYLGGSSGDAGLGVALISDTTGKTNAVITGYTASTNFPTTPGAFQTTHGGGTYDAFVTELNDSGTGLVYSTFLGGRNQDKGQGIAVDAAGNAYVTGLTASTNFPTSKAFQATSGGGASGFVAELNNTGSALVYSTYLNGSRPNSIAVDGLSRVYLTGSTSSTSFPTTAGVLQTSLTGQSDAFVTKFDPSQSGPSSLVYSTYLGGGTTDVGNGIAVDSLGNAYVTGYTDSADFPTVNAYQSAFGGGSDAFVSKLNANGSTLAYSTFLGGSGIEDGTSSSPAGRIAVDAAGIAYVTGETRSSNFPVTTNALQNSYAGGGADAFVTKIDPTLAGSLSVVYSTFLGGSVGGDTGYSIAVDRSGNAYVTGQTASTNFPTQNALQGNMGGPLHSSDAFVTKISLTAAVPSPSLAVSGFPSSTTAGIVGSLTVTAQDASGATLIGYLGTVHFTSGDPQAVLPADFTFTAADQGTHTFVVTLKTAGMQLLKTADTAVPGMMGAEANILIRPAAATHFLISGPTSIASGKSFSITVNVLDAYGNIAMGYVGTIHFASTDSTATLPANTTFTAADNGVHTSTGVKLKKRGQQTISVVDMLTPALTNSLTIAVN